MSDPGPEEEPQSNLALHLNEKISHATIHLDNAEWVGCTFVRCTLIYSGGPTRLAQNDFQSCDWRFGGGAATTIGILALMYRSGGDGRRAVENMLDFPERPN